MKLEYKIVPRLKKRWFRSPVMLYDLIKETKWTKYEDSCVWKTENHSKEEIICVFASKEEAELYKTSLEQ